MRSTVAAVRTSSPLARSSTRLRSPRGAAQRIGPDADDFSGSPYTAKVSVHSPGEPAALPVLDHGREGRIGRP